MKSLNNLKHVQPFQKCYTYFRRCGPPPWRVVKCLNDSVRTSLSEQRLSSHIYWSNVDTTVNWSLTTETMRSESKLLHLGEYNLALIKMPNNCLEERSHLLRFVYFYLYGRPWVRQSALLMNCNLSLLCLLTDSDVFMDDVNRKMSMGMIVCSLPNWVNVRLNRQGYLLEDSSSWSRRRTWVTSPWDQIFVFTSTVFTQRC